MKNKISKRLIAFLLCMVLVIGNSVSILADTPAPEKATVENQTKDASTTKKEDASKKTKAGDGTENVSAQSEDSADTKKPSDEDPAPEVKTTEEKKETTEAFTEKKDDSVAADEKKDDPAEVTTKAKVDTDKTDEMTTETTTGEQDETKGAEESSTKGKEETDGSNVTGGTTETSETSEGTTETAAAETTTETAEATTATDELKYEDEEVIITVSANEENAIPAGAALKVVPIRSDNTATQAQYTEVEKQLQEKAEKEDYTTLGFLAYDITFTDAQGNEVEPSGQVTVNMSYKKAVLPAGINAKSEEAADAEVTVLHLEENANKQVQNVANLAENNQLQNIEVTDANAVKQAEFVAESFSVFTLTWGRQNQIQAQVIDTKGNEITFGGTGSGSSVSVSGYYDSNIGSIDFTNNDDIQDISNGHVNNEKPKDYRFIKAVILDNDEKYPEDLGTTIQSFSRVSSRKGYKYTYTPMGETWSQDFDREKQTLYFVYAADELTTIETVDSTSEGITMTMLNYKNSGNGILSEDRDGPYGKGNVKQGMLQKVLDKNGFPNVNEGGSSRNLSSLFSKDKNNFVNHLFSQKIYDETGYYEYSSFENYAYLDPKNGGNFTVYNQIGTPSDEAVQNNGKPAFFYMRGNFMPYNRIEEGKFSRNTNLYDEDGHMLDTDDSRYNEPLYKTQDTNDYYFSMYMEADFAQPKDGKVTHDVSGTNDMVYEFNGDDDLWIYIDNVLVLDIGGIHDAHSGSINFATGKVVVNDSKNTDPDNITQLPTTIKQCFEEAGIFPDRTKWDDAKVSDYFTGNTFKNYTSHNIKMFYMERGAGASNLHMKFNIQPIPEGEIQVSKELSNTDKDKYANVEFAFQVYAQKEVGTDDVGNPTFSDEFVPITRADKEKYPVVYNGTENEVKWNESGNTFYLKPGETAAISGLQANQKYYVVETGVKSEEYDDIKINDTSYEEFDENKEQIREPIRDVKTTTDEVGDRPVVVYTNNCSGANRKELWITKSMAEGQSSGTDEFTFKVELEGTDGDLQAYSGKYYVEDDETPKTTTDGMIKIQSGQTIKITEILAGTEFKVTEQDISDEYLGNPIIEEVKKGDSWGIKDFQGSRGFSSDEGTDTTHCTGEIILGKNAQVKFTNSKNVTSVYVAKTWEQGNGNVKQETVTFGVFKQRGNTLTELVQIADINQNTGWKHTFTDLPVKENDTDIQYTIREIAKTDQTGDGTYPLDGEHYSILDEEDCVNEYYHASDNASGQGTDSSPLTIQNSLKTFGINVVKKDSDGNWLKGVEFELCLDKAGMQKVYFVKTGTGYEYSSSNVEGASTTLITNDVEGTTTDEKDNPNLVITGLPADTYYLIETKTQSGFSLLANPVEIVLPCASDELSESQSPYYQERDGSQTTYYYDSYTAVIENNKLFTMPEAGGRNIFLMTLAGTAMIALAGGSAIYYRRRRGVHNRRGR